MKRVFCTKGIYASGMVLQRNTVNCIFGEGPSDAEVILSFRKKTYKTVSHKDGSWKIEYNPGEAGGPFEMKLTCEDQSISLTDVFVGEVWVNSGQSNAELPMVRMRFNYEEELKLPENPHIRMITIPIVYSLRGERDSVEKPTWLAANSENIPLMSGTSYFFAKKLAEELKVPVGIINASQGGSPIASWLSEDFISERQFSLDYYKKLQFWQIPENENDKKKDLQKNQSEWDSEIWSADKGNSGNWPDLSFSELDATWTDCEIPGELSCNNSAGILWIKKQIMLTKKQVEHFNKTKTWLWLGTIVDADRAYVNGTEVGVTYYCYPPRRYEVPAGLLHEGENTITVRVQKNSKYGNIRFFEEKPYYLFTENVKVYPVACRNIEQTPVHGPVPEDGELIPLSGTWKQKVGCTVRDCPPQMFFEWLPTALFNGMLAPCFNYAVAGALWYQGESDTGIPGEYKDLLTGMIKLWRERFVYHVNNMPFVIMQLPNWAEGWESYFNHDDWALMREAQSKAAEEAPDAAFAVTIDAGEWNDLHPEKKKTCGTRAANEALRIAYKKPVNPVPVAEYCQRNEKNFAVRFNCGKASLYAYKVSTKYEGKNALVADFNSKTDEIRGFTFVTSTGKVMEAEARLVSDRDVEIYYPKKLPEEDGNLKELRYLWANNPEAVNLYSSDGIPAAPFRVVL